EKPFMQKNLPKYTPPWVRRVTVWAESSRREVSYALCDDRRTLLWFANQRAVEYHPPLFRGDAWDRPTHLVIDIDPPAPDDFASAVRAAHLVREAMDGSGLSGAVKTSGAKGVHVFVPLDGRAPAADAAAATRALAARAERLDPAFTTTAFIREDRGGKVFLDSTRAGSATVVAAYSPRIRPGTPVSFPVPWDDLGAVAPADFTVRNAAGLLDGRDPLGRAHAAAADPARGPGRGGPRHPCGAGAGHARGQAPRPQPPGEVSGPHRDRGRPAAPGARPFPGRRLNGGPEVLLGDGFGARGLGEAARRRDLLAAGPARAAVPRGLAPPVPGGHDVVRRRVGAGPVQVGAEPDQEALHVLLRADHEPHELARRPQLVAALADEHPVVGDQVVAQRDAVPAVRQLDHDEVPLRREDLQPRQGRELLRHHHPVAGQQPQALLVLRTVLAQQEHHDLGEGV